LHSKEVDRCLESVKFTFPDNLIPTQTRKRLHALKMRGMAIWMDLPLKPMDLAVCSDRHSEW
jgi:hypothetical protein